MRTRNEEKKIKKGIQKPKIKKRDSKIREAKPKNEKHDSRMRSTTEFSRL